MMKVRAFISYVVFVALVTTWSAGFGGILYQACPADCCSSVKDHSSCDLENPSNEICGVSMTGEQVADACSCNSTCDNTGSECVYFLAGTVQQVMAWVPFLSPFAFKLPILSLQDHASQNFRPPPISLA